MNRWQREAAALLGTILPDYGPANLARDPLSFPHRYRNPRDQEVVALIAALFAFGNARAVMAATERVLESLGASPYESVRAGSALRRQSAGLGSAAVHRWVREADLQQLLETLKEAYERHPTLESLFLEGYQATDPDCGPALHQFSKAMLSLAPGSRHGRGFRYFFPSPQDGSPCKRLALFLRWVVRPADGVDLGLWREISPAKLIVPLDTHVYQFARRYRLSRYRSPSWRFARDVTEFLRTLDPLDPVKYDFAICHHGMEDGVPN